LGQIPSVPQIEMQLATPLRPTVGGIGAGILNTKRIDIVAALLIAASFLWLFMKTETVSEPDEMEYIEYLGEKFKITASYPDFDDYKNDPDNIVPSENARIVRRMKEARIAGTYPSRMAMVHAVQNLVFPGYGSSSSGTMQKDGSFLALMSVEIPRADQERHFVFRDRGGTQLLLDDFIESSEISIVHVREENGQLVYGDAGGRQVLVRPIAEQK
jgi:hypothetical protein